MSNSLGPHGLSMEFCRPEYWSGWPFPSPGDLPNPGIEPRFSCTAGRFFTNWAIREAHFLRSSCEIVYLTTLIFLKFYFMLGFSWLMGFPGGTLVKNPPANAGGEMQVRSLTWEDLLEKEVATCSSIFTWKISQTEEPGGLQSMGIIKSQTWLSKHAYNWSVILYYF